MKREALIFYLKELRDLEIAKYKLNDRINIEKYNYDKYNINNGTISLQDVPQFKPIIELVKLIFVIAMFIIATISFVMLAKTMVYSNGWGILDNFEKLIKYAFILSFSAILGGIAFTYGWCGYFKNKKHYYSIILKNKKEVERIKENQNTLEKYKQQYEKNMSIYKNDFRNVEQLLTNYYSLNIIPNQYRNIESIMYIYDYMQSSQENLKDALISNQINIGINKILEKLDTIIANQGDMILANRRFESLQQNIIDQNNQMLNSFYNIETDTKESAYYSKLSTYYTAANAYYSYAKYLND